MSNKVRSGVASREHIYSDPSICETGRSGPCLTTSIPQCYHQLPIRFWEDSERALSQGTEWDSNHRLSRQEERVLTTMLVLTTMTVSTTMTVLTTMLVFPNPFLAVLPWQQYNERVSFLTKVFCNYACMHGSTLAGIIRHQFIIQNSDIFFKIFCDGSFKFPLKMLNFPSLGNNVLCHPKLDMSNIEKENSPRCL